MVSPSPRLQKGLAVVTAVIPTAVFFINFCGWIFGCGCRSWWACASASCNIHMQGVKHCPWCLYDGQGFRVAFVLVVAAQAAIIIFAPGRMDGKYRFALALAALPLVGGAVAAIYGWVSHYWS